MKSKVVIGIVCTLLCVRVVLAAPETQIIYSTTDLGLDRWQYTYDVMNISLTDGIEEFTIWFGIDLYDNLAVETLDPPAGNWDEIVWQPDPVLKDDGGYDALVESWNPGISQGQTVSGFSVTFDWLGIGEPSSQY